MISGHPAIWVEGVVVGGATESVPNDANVVVFLPHSLQLQIDFTGAEARAGATHAAELVIDRLRRRSFL